MLDAGPPGLEPPTGCVAALIAGSIFAQQAVADACRPLNLEPAAPRG